MILKYLGVLFDNLEISEDGFWINGGIKDSDHRVFSFYTKRGEYGESSFYFDESDFKIIKLMFDLSPSETVTLTKKVFSKKISPKINNTPFFVIDVNK